MLSNEIDLTVEQIPQNQIDIYAGEGDYNALVNKPQINGITLEGNRTSADLRLASAAQGAKADSALQSGDNVSNLTNDSNYQTGSEVTSSISDHNTSASAHSTLFAGKQDTISDLSTIRSGAEAGATAVQPGDLATVATTGDYSDLTGTPALATVATTGSYTDLSNKPTIPTVDQTYDGTSSNAQSGVAIAGELTNYQVALVSGTNIKTVNNNSLLGSGNIALDTLPSQTGQSGKYLTTDGTDASWANVPTELPTQSGNSGKFLTTDGSAVSWAAVDALPSQTGQSGKFLTTDGSSASWASVQNSGGKQIGEVYFSASSSSVDNPGGLPLFTGETIANADQLYPDFYDWVADHSELQITAANYETAIATYGECPKYVIDTTNHTIRLPKLVNYLKMANSTDGIAQSAAGLPNITGDVPGRGWNNVNSVSGAFYTTQNGTDGRFAGENGNGKAITFNASNSNSIYGNSNTVTPAHTTLFPWVCAYNAAVPASTAQAAEFQAALSGKADTNLSNVANTATKSIDGQWVNSTLTIIGTATTINASSYNDYDLSNYLPNDTYNYELLGYISANTGSTSGDGLDIYIASPGLLDNVRVCRTITRTSSSSWTSGCFVVPSGTQRKIRMGTFTSNNCTVNFFRIIAYRRMGTNL